MPHAHGTPDRHVHVEPVGGGAGGDCDNCYTFQASDHVYMGSQVIVLSGGANITVSTNGSTVFFDGAAAGTGGGISGISASDTLYTSGTVRFTGSNAATVRSGTGQRVIIDVPLQTEYVFSNSNDVTFGSNGSTVTASFSQSTHAHSAYVFSNSNDITFGTNGSTVTASFSQSTHSHAADNSIAISASDALFTSGTVRFTGSEGITVATSGTGTQQTVIISGSTHSHSTALSAAIQSVIPVGLFTTGTTTTLSGPEIGLGGGLGVWLSQSTGAASTNISLVGWLFGNANSVTFGNNQRTITASFSQSTHSHSTGPSAIQASNATFTSGTVAFTGTEGITIATSGTGTQQTVIVSGSTHSHSAFVLSESNGLSWGTNASTVTGSYSQSTHAHTAYVFSNSNNVSFGTNGSTVTATATFAGGAGPDALQASNATFTSGTVVFTGTNGITVNTSGAGANQTIGISGHNHGGISASDTVFTSGTVVFTGTGGWVTVNTSGTGTQQTVGISVSTHGHTGAGTVYEFEPIPKGAIQGGWTAGAQSTGQSLTVIPTIIPNANLQTMRWYGSFATTTNAASSCSFSWGLAYYTKANSTSLASVSSTSWSSTFSANATSNLSNISGQRIWSATMDWALTPGEYYFAGYWRSSGAGTMSQQIYTISTHGHSGLAGAATAESQRFMWQFYGVRSNGTTAAFPAAIAGSEMIYTGAAISFPHYHLMGT